MHRLSHGTWIHCHICVSSDLSRRSAVITMTLPLLLLLVSRGQGGVDGSWDGFSES